jgi:hypothetical protein
MNPPELIIPDQPRPSKFPIMLSAVMFPGAGQFAQRRWGPAVIYSILFISCFAVIMVSAFRIIATNLGAALTFASAQPNKSFAAVSPSALIVPLIISIVVWIAGLADTYFAYRRACSSWAEQKLERKLKGVVAVMVLAAICFAGDLFAGTTRNIFALVRSNDVAGVEKFLKNSSPTSVECRIGDGITPLHLAAALNHKEITALLIRRGADPEARTKGGFTPLHWAASRDAASTAELLIRGGCDLNAVSLKGVTPLHWAASKNATNVVKLLVAAGARIEPRTAAGLTPLHWAVMKEANESALVIAFKAVSDKMEEEPPEAAVEPEVTEPEIAVKKAADTNTTVEVPVVKETHPASRDLSSAQPADAEDIVINLGVGEDLIFVWIKTLDMWVGKYEITNNQYRRFNAEHTSMFREKFSLDGKLQPVVYVSWNDAKEFCKWLNETCSDTLPVKCEFRLPTEAEWMAFARCGTDRKYPWGDQMPPKFGNYSDMAAKEKLQDWKGVNYYNDGYVVTCPVADSGSNEWGLYGVGGNVWEWCEDWYDAGKNYKTRHGGSWDFDDESCITVEKRGFDRPSVRDDTIGFRVVIGKKKQQARSSGSEAPTAPAVLDEKQVPGNLEVPR